MAPADLPPDPGQSGGTLGPSLLGQRGSLYYDGAAMRSIALVAIVSLALSVAGCAGTGGSPSGAPSAVTPSASTTADASAAPDDTELAPTPVPGGQTVEPAPAESHKPTTTKTDWA